MAVINAVLTYKLRQIEKQSRLKEEKVKTIHAIEPGLPLYRLDYVLMEQVLYNLVYNTSVYTPAYSEISITAKQNNSKTYLWDIETDEHSSVANETSYLILQIEDRGKGFPPVK